MQVVSLLPSATEICYALGVEPAGVSHSCDYPPEAADQPTLTRSRIDTDGDAATIDEQVREIDGSAYALRTDRLAEIDPDLLLTQATCEVCAVDATVVHEAVRELGLDTEVLTVDPHSVEEMLEDIERVGAAVGREGRAASVVADLRERIAAATVDETATADDPSGRPRTLVFDWTEPPMLAGHWIPGMIDRAGGQIDRPVTDDPAPSVPIEWSWVREYDPEVLIVAPCGFEPPRAREAVADLRARDGWDELTAVKRGEVYAADGSGLFNRPGPRLVDTLELLRDTLDATRGVGDDDRVHAVGERVTPAD